MVEQYLWVGEVCRRMRLPAHRVGSKAVLLQLGSASRISWNHFGSFHHIILIFDSRSAMGRNLMHVDLDS